MLKIKKGALLVYSMAFFVCLLSPFSVFADTSEPVDWPGAGKSQDWYAACKLNDQADDLQKVLYKPGSTTIDKVIADKIIALYKKAIARYPYETGFYDNLAKLHDDLGDDKTAEVNYRKSIQVKEKYRGPQNKIRYPDTYLSLARLCVKHKEIKDADLYFKKACEHFKSKECFAEYASFLKSEKRDADAAAILKRSEDIENQSAR